MDLKTRLIMNKTQLISALMSAMELEEEHTPHVAKFFIEDFDWDHVEPDKVEKVKDILGVIKQQTIEHGRILEELIGTLQASGTDEF
jgi:hypothetical protein